MTSYRISIKRKRNKHILIWRHAWGWFSKNSYTIKTTKHLLSSILRHNLSKFVTRTGLHWSKQLETTFSSIFWKTVARHLYLSTFCWIFLRESCFKMDWHLTFLRWKQMVSFSSDYALSHTVISQYINFDRRKYSQQVRKLHTWTVQSYSPGGVSVHPHLIHAALDPPESTYQMTSRSVQSFLHSLRQRLTILHNNNDIIIIQYL